MVWLKSRPKLQGPDRRLDPVRLSAASAYALRALVHITSAKGDASVPSHVIAAAQGLREEYLLKVLRPLASARILLSLKGPNGGYRLARPADRITLADVIEAVGGPLRGIVPDIDATGKNRDRIAQELAATCDRTADLVRQQLRRVTVQDLAGKKA
jgi:Rrf2 family protein